MKCKVVGVSSEDYTSKKTGKPVNGVSVQIVREPTSRETNVKGLIADSIYISAESPLYHKLPKFDFDSLYDFEYEYDGRYSYLSSVVPVA